MAPFSSELYDVFTISPTPSEAEIDCYRDISLEGLRLDPTSFRTVYANAVKHPREWFINRLNLPEGITIITRVKASGQWVATAVMRADMAAMLPNEVEEEGKKAFMLAALWVHPEHRRRGIAQRMFESGLEWAEAYPSDGKAKYATVAVFSDNAAVSLYRSLGFVEKEEHVEGGRPVSWLSMPLN